MREEKDYCPKCGKPKTELFKDVARRAYQKGFSNVWRSITLIEDDHRREFESWWASELRDAQKRQGQK